MASRSQSCTSGGPTPTPNPITLTLRLTLSLTLTLTLALTRWADIYLDLILVGVAFNGGLLLKHAFYLCEPHDNLAYWPEVLDDGSPEGRQLSGHGPKKACVGLFVGVVHALAFAAPLLSAWAKETIFDAQVAPACPTELSKEAQPVPPS